MKLNSDYSCPVVVLLPIFLILFRTLRELRFDHQVRDLPADQRFHEAT